MLLMKCHNTRKEFYSEDCYRVYCHLILIGILVCSYLIRYLINLFFLYIILLSYYGRTHTYIHTHTRAYTYRAVKVCIKWWNSAFCSVIVKRLMSSLSVFQYQVYQLSLDCFYDAFWETLARGTRLLLQLVIYNDGETCVIIFTV